MQTRNTPRRTAYRIFCTDCDEAHNLDNAGFATDRRNVLGRMSDVRGVAFDHVRFAANTCSQQNFVVEVTKANGRSTEFRYGIFDGRLVEVECDPAETEAAYTRIGF